jgi:hypothetical protein
MIRRHEFGPEGHARQSLPPEVVSDLAAQTAAVMLGAWDDEAWLVWEP